MPRGRKKKKKQILNYDIEKEMEFLNNITLRRGIIKIFALFLLVSLNWTGLGQIGQTLSYFNDTENSPKNVYSAGTLYFSLLASGWENSGTEQTKTINIKNNGSLDFQYNFDVNIIGGDVGCEDLIFKAKLEGDEKYNGPLKDFVFGSTEFLASSHEKNWIFTAPREYQSLDCELEFVFEAWQENLNWQQGFWHEKIHNNHLQIRNVFVEQDENDDESDEFGEDIEDIGNETIQDEDVKEEPVDEEPVLEPEDSFENDEGVENEEDNQEVENTEEEVVEDIIEEDPVEEEVIEEIEDEQVIVKEETVEEENNEENNEEDN